MTHSNSRLLGVLSKAVIVSAAALVVAGVIWRGIALEEIQRLWRDLFDRPSGPMSFRFILQPVMATIAAIVDGLKDARTGRSPYFWTVMSNPQERVARLREGLNATAKIILVGLAMDVTYQIIVFKTLYPVEALFIALLLAFVPYLLIRGPVERIAGRGRSDAPADEIR
jgi:hypothetical protein